jgi:hypothetical protein
LQTRTDPATVLHLELGISKASSLVAGVKRAPQPVPGLVKGDLTNPWSSLILVKGFNNKRSFAQGGLPLGSGRLPELPDLPQRADPGLETALPPVAASGRHRPRGRRVPLQPGRRQTGGGPMVQRCLRLSRTGGLPSPVRDKSGLCGNQTEHTLFPMGGRHHHGRKGILDRLPTGCRRRLFRRI